MVELGGMIARFYRSGVESSLFKSFVIAPGDRHERRDIVRRLVHAALTATCLLPVGFSQTIQPAEASQHVGQISTVCGHIAGERTAYGSRGAPTFIDLGQVYPHEVFTAVVWQEHRASVGTLPASGSVCVTGTITEYHGIPQIQLLDRHSWYVPSLSNNDHYTNSDGVKVHSPAYSSGGVPAPATAQCRDGTYSFSQHRSGTCSHHGGVDHWL
jgi:hypothetical protein